MSESESTHDLLCTIGARMARSLVPQDADYQSAYLMCLWYIEVSSKWTSCTRPMHLRDLTCQWINDLAPGV